MLKAVLVHNDTISTIWVQSENPTPYPALPFYIPVNPGQWAEVWVIAARD